MANKKDLMIPPQGMWGGIVTRAKLILRLLGDKRVSPWLKLIPIGALIYVISPWDLIMLVPGIDALDDIGVFSFGMYLFVELCPPDIVHEHIKALSANTNIEEHDDIVEAESVEIKNEKK